MIFKSGSKGKDVEKIQERLKTLGYLSAAVDGIYGIETRQAVVAYQTDLGLNADGVVGVKTWEKMFPIERPSPLTICVPESRTQLYDVFGDPLTSGHWESFGGFCETPPELNHIFHSTYKAKNGFWCNKLLTSIFQRVYETIVKEGLAGELYSFDGCHNVRYSRGTEVLSMHAWGIAVDHNAKTNPLGSTGDIHRKIVAVFESEGFFWGGNFKRRDPMHFEFTNDGC